MTNFEKVVEFHEKFHIPQVNLDATGGVVLRLRLMMEELAEVTKAISLKDDENLAKELADLLYVVYGTADYFHIPIDDVFAEVHRSNMTKDPAKDAGGKVVKGPNYIPPRVKEVLDGSIDRSSGKWSVGTPCPTL